MNLWDIAAGILIVKEAGGIINEFDLSQSSNIKLIASSENINAKMLEKITCACPNVKKNPKKPQPGADSHCYSHSFGEAPAVHFSSQCKFGAICVNANLSCVTAQSITFPAMLSRLWSEF